MAYGPVLNAAAVLLSCRGNVPAGRAAQLIGMLTGENVSAGWADKAVARMSGRLRAGGFDEAMAAALAAEDVLAADETPVNVPGKTPVPAPADDAGEADPGEEDGKKAAAGAPHVLVVTTPDARRRLLLAMASRRTARVGAGIPAAFTGHLMTDGYAGCQHLPDRIAGIQQCRRHVVRRCRAVAGPGPGSLQPRAEGIIAIPAEAHRAAEDARARGGTALDPKTLDDLRERYDKAAVRGIICSRLRDRASGNHPGYALGCWPRDYKEQVFLFTRDFHVDRTNNVSETGAKAAKRRQAVSGYWHSPATLARRCRIRSCLDSAAAHGTTALDGEGFLALRLVVSRDDGGERDLECLRVDHAQERERVLHLVDGGLRQAVGTLLGGVVECFDHVGRPVVALQASRVADPFCERLGHEFVVSRSLSIASRRRVVVTAGYSGRR